MKKPEKYPNLEGMQHHCSICGQDHHSKDIGYNDCWDDREKWLKEWLPNIKDKKFIDCASEMVHKAYCAFKKEKDGEEYWTKGNWNLLSEKWKEADRYTVRAVLEAIAKRLNKPAD